MGHVARNLALVDSRLALSAQEAPSEARVELRVDPSDPDEAVARVHAAVLERISALRPAVGGVPSPSPPRPAQS